MVCVAVQNAKTFWIEKEGFQEITLPLRTAEAKKALMTYGTDAAALQKILM